MPVHPNFAHCVREILDVGCGANKPHAELGCACSERGTHAAFVKGGQLGGERRDGLLGQLERAGGASWEAERREGGGRHLLKIQRSAAMQKRQA